jgi:hypothetical protein
MSKTEPDLWTAATSGGAYWDVVYRGSWQEAGKAIAAVILADGDVETAEIDDAGHVICRWHEDGEEMKEVWSLLDLDPNEVDDAMIVDLS